MKSKKILIFASMVILSLVTILVLQRNVLAANVEILDGNGNLVVNSIKPTTEQECYVYISNKLMTMDGINEAFPVNINSDYTVCDIEIYYSDGTNETLKNVKVVYKDGNEKTKAIIDNFAKKIPAEKTFNLNDLEIINYWLNGYDKNDNSKYRDIMANYSGELKEILNNANIGISFTTATGAGSNAVFYQEALGEAVLSYNGINYANLNFVGARVNNIIYVPDNTGNTKEELLAAAQKRIDEYVGTKGKVTLSYEGDIMEACLKYYYENFTEWKEMDENMTFEEYKNSPFRPAIDLREETGLDEIAEDTYCFSATIKGVKHYIIIERNSSKMLTPSYKTSDINTNVQINSTSSLIPLDTVIQAEEITSGNDYEKILKILNVEDSTTFDLKLFSNSMNKNITKLDKTTFEVKIPLPENLKDKTLIVYYIDSNGKIIEYDVNIKDGYAIFTTDHFSIYTIAEKKTIAETPINESEQISENVSLKDEKDETPKTGTTDIIGYVLFVATISALGINLIIQKENNKRHN